MRGIKLMYSYSRLFKYIHFLFCSLSRTSIFCHICFTACVCFQAKPRRVKESSYRSLQVAHAATRQKARELSVTVSAPVTGRVMESLDSKLNVCEDGKCAEVFSFIFFSLPPPSPPLLLLLCEFRKKKFSLSSR